MSKKATMTVRMRESILGTTAGVSGAAALVQTAEFAEGAKKIMRKPSLISLLVSQKFATA